MKNMKYTETRIMDADNLRRVCIENRWYTRGDNRAYNALFDRLYDENGCHENITTEKLAEIATDIYEHSNITDYTVTTIMYILEKDACMVTFDVA